ncbi:MAG TPA: HEAT repeat domain-containing protein [Anaeromyxobacter sp.]|nr:HEAT repeat domain-containing protein [Anaeromyxobacter sp.]
MVPAPVLLLALLVAAAPAEPGTEDQVRGLLSAIDRPVPPEAWRAVGPAAEPVLAAIAGAPDELPSRRARALEGLSALGGARAESLHRSLAADARAPRLVRRTAVRGLGQILPPARLLPAAGPLLRDPDPAVRAAAAEVLAARAPAEACGAIRTQAAGEGDGELRYRRALRSCGGTRR